MHRRGEGIVDIDMLSHKTLKKSNDDINDWFKWLFKSPYMSSKEDKTRSVFKNITKNPSQGGGILKAVRK